MASMAPLVIYLLLQFKSWWALFPAKADSWWELFLPGAGRWSLSWWILVVVAPDWGRFSTGEASHLVLRGVACTDIPKYQPNHAMAK
jgi:hypothetical protein